MRKLAFIVLLFLSGQAAAQHCPWDCSGMILLKTDLTGDEFKRLSPVLVDNNEQVVVDTIYGTGLETNDSCRFLSYADFVNYRTDKIKLHHWYGFDTLYYFAKGQYLVRYNFCKYKKEGNNDLFIRFTDPVTREDHYIDIPIGRRIHLHDLNREIRERKTLEEIPSLQGLVLELSRKEWGLPDR